MASQFGATQPIADWMRKFVYTPAETLETVFGKLPPHSKDDNSWHDSMVRKANDSFRTLADRKPLGAKKKTSKKAAKKAKPRKRG